MEFRQHGRGAMTNSVCNSGRDSTRPPGPATDYALYLRTGAGSPPRPTMRDRRPRSIRPRPRIRCRRWQSRRRHPSRPTSPILAARPEPRAPIGYRSAALQPYAGLAGYGALIGQALPDTDRARVRSRVQDDPLAAHADVVIDAAEQSARRAGGRPRATLFDEVTRIVDGIQSRPRRTPPQRKAPHEGGGDDRRGGGNKVTARKAAGADENGIPRARPAGRRNAAQGKRTHRQGRSQSR